MDTLQIHRTPSAVTLHDAQDRICFAIEASLADNTYHLSVRSVTQCRQSIGPYPDFWHEEIAKIVWNCDTPFIILHGNRFDIDTFMRSDGLFDNSRVFVGPGDALLRWKVRPWAVELRNNSTGLLLARWRPHQNRIKSLFSKSRGTLLEINSLYNKDTNMRNAIVLTWIIIDGLLLRREQNYNDSNNIL